MSRVSIDPDLQGPLARSLAVVFISGLAYVVPTILAWYRSHHNTLAIGALNLLLGWTVIGWIGALIWALTSRPEKS
jgi:ABC-type transport system involved in cytochrome c biogenesis permease component